ncbi:hypothetical protein BJ508DRAFT_379484 [Ascobolus immersus RN42]|uniref:Uncharacterized protein n=1 Tax=Ascobolus immersus RN42 TaxID=1160509 RepID=A0A3N4I3G2_ASCIM|nr:hypothetical protein BJ508DRAFT_379484 [Ascobolus immersus RN42]
MRTYTKKEQLVLARRLIATSFHKVGSYKSRSGYESENKVGQITVRQNKQSLQVALDAVSVPEGILAIHQATRYFYRIYNTFRRILEAVTKNSVQETDIATRGIRCQQTKYEKNSAIKHWQVSTRNWHTSSMGMYFEYSLLRSVNPKSHETKKRIFDHIDRRPMASIDRNLKARYLYRIYNTFRTIGHEAQRSGKSSVRKNSAAGPITREISQLSNVYQGIVERTIAWGWISLLRSINLKIAKSHRSWVLLSKSVERVPKLGYEDTIRQNNTVFERVTGPNGSSTLGWNSLREDMYPGVTFF